MARLQIGRPTEDPNVIEWVDISDKVIMVEMKIDTSKFDDAMASLALDRRTNPCQEMCQGCGVVQCLGEDPHKEGFGPFHVFAYHEHLPTQGLLEHETEHDRHDEGTED